MNKEYNKIKYVDVSDKDNNCFYNSVFKILESIPDKEGVYYNRTKINSGSMLRKIICRSIIVQSSDNYKHFKEYLIFIKNLIKNKIRELKITDYNLLDNSAKHDLCHSVSILSGTNVTEINALISNNILNINLNDDNSAHVILEYLKVKNRMPSYAEMMYVKKDILYNFNIYIISISCDSASRHLLQVYYSLDKDVRQQLMLHNLLQLPNDDGQNRSDINSLIKNNIQNISRELARYSTRDWYIEIAIDDITFPFKNETCNFGVLITDDSHYNILKINNKFIFEYEYLQKLIKSSIDSSDRFNYDPVSKAYISRSRRSINRQNSSPI
jgi:hypothetical protein